MRTALVVGGGLAGAAFACRVGPRATVVERERGPREKVCGDFLSHEALAYLDALGVDGPSLGAVAIRAVRLATRRGTTTVDLPFPAASLSRRVLDEAVLVRAESAGARVVRGGCVREVECGTTRVRARLADARTIEADDLVLATGKHDLRGLARPPGRHDGLVAFKMHFALAAAQRSALDGHVELAPFVGGYAGLQPIEGGVANLCLLVAKERLASLGGSWSALLSAVRAESAHLDARLAGALAAFRKPLALSHIPYGYVHRPVGGERVFRLGDQVAVIPSFAGDGMAIALHGARLAADTWLANGDASAYHARIARDVRAPIALGTALSHLLVRGWGARLAGALANVFPSLVRAIATRTRIRDGALVVAPRRAAA